MKQTVDVYAKLMDSIWADDPDADLRWSAIQAYLPKEEETNLLEKMAEYGIIAAVNPSFIYHQGRSFSNNPGVDRMARLKPMRSYLDAGVKVAVGSDYGTSPYSPWIGLCAMLTRTDLWGDQHGDRGPDLAGGGAEGDDPRQRLSHVLGRLERESRARVSRGAPEPSGSLSRLGVERTRNDVGARSPSGTRRSPR